MSNRTNQRRGEGTRNQWKPELPSSGCGHPDDDPLVVSKNRKHTHHPDEPRKQITSGCSGEGHNGQKGRSVWKTLSRRSERRAIKNEKIPKVGKPGKPKIYETGEEP